MHAPQFMQHLPFPAGFQAGFQPGAGAPAGGRLRWVPIVLAAGALAVAASLARPVAPMKQADWLARLAESGDTGAQLQLAAAYHDGRDGLTADPRTALQWLTRAARGGNAYAADQLANAYAQGDGTPVDAAQARHWWQVAARAGNADAKHQLGQDRPGPLETVLSLLTGKTLSEQARPALLARAEGGDATAKYQVAIRYRDGAAGFPRDAAQSAAWLKRAAASGSAPARGLLAAGASLAQNP